MKPLRIALEISAVLGVSISAGATPATAQNTASYRDQIKSLATKLGACHRSSAIRHANAGADSVSAVRTAENECRNLEAPIRTLLRRHLSSAQVDAAMSAVKERSRNTLLDEVATRSTEPTTVDPQLARCMPQTVKPGTLWSSVSPQQKRSTIACVVKFSAAAINEQAPVKVDENTTLISAVAVGTTLMYNYKVTTPVESFTDVKRARLETSTRENVCGSSGMKFVMSSGGAYLYMWTDPNGRILMRARIDNCR